MLTTAHGPHGLWRSSGGQGWAVWAQSRQPASSGQNFYRAMLCIRGTSRGLVFVCVCLCLSQVGVLLKRLNIGPQKQHHTIAQGLYSFFDAKNLREIRLSKQKFLIQICRFWAASCTKMRLAAELVSALA